MNTIKIKRIYEEPSTEDGCRILVDRLWPRGLSKEKANIDIWARDVAPSAELRKEYHSGCGTAEEFRKKYAKELEANQKALEFAELVKERLNAGNVTLLSASAEQLHSILLKEWIEKQP